MNEGVKVRVGAEVSSFKQGMGQVVRELQKIGANTEKESRKSREELNKISGSFSSIGKAAKTFAGTMVTAFAAIKIKQFVESTITAYGTYETALVDMGKVTHRDIDLIKVDIRTLPPALGSATDLLKGYYQVISAGVTEPKEALELLTTASKTSAAAHVTQDEAVKALTKVMAGMSKEVRTAVEASDLLFAIEKAGQTTVGELVPIIGDLASISQEAGLKAGDLGASLAQVTQFAGSTAEAATQVKALMRTMIKPTAEMNDLFKDQGGALNAIKKIGFPEVLRMIAEKGGDAEGVTNLLGGRIESLMGFLAISKDNFTGFNEKLKIMGERAGESEAAFGRWHETFEGTLHEFKNLMENLRIEFGEKFAPKLREALKSLSNWLKDNKDAIIGFITDVGAVVPWTLKELDKIAKNFAKSVSEPADALDVLWGNLKKINKEIDKEEEKLSKLISVKNKNKNADKAWADAYEYAWKQTYKEVTDKLKELNTQKNILVKTVIREYEERDKLNIGLKETNDKLEDSSSKMQDLTDKTNVIIGVTKDLSTTYNSVGDEIEKELKGITAHSKTEGAAVTKAWNVAAQSIEDAFLTRYPTMLEDNQSFWEDMIADATYGMSESTKEVDKFFEAVKDGWKEAVTETKTSYEFMKDLTKDFVGSVKGAIQGTLTEIFRGNFSEIGNIWENMLNNMASLLSSFVMSAIASGDYITAGIAAAIGTVAGLIKNAFFGEKTKYAEVGAAVARWIGDAFWVEFQATGKNAKDWGKKLADKLNESLSDHLKPFNEIFNRAITIKSIPGMDDALTDFQVKFAAIYKSGFEGFSISENANWEEEFEVIMNHIKAQWDVGIQQMMDDLGFQSIEQLEQYIARMEELIHQSSATLGVAMRAGLDTGSFEDFEKTLYDSIYNQILDAMITAFMQSELFRKALVPFFDAMDKAMDSIYDPEVFKAKMTDAIGLLKAGVESVKPAFDSISGVIAEVKAMLGLGGSTSNIPEAHGGASVETSGIAKLEKFETVLTRDQLSKMLLNINAPEEDYDYAQDNIITNLRNLIGGDSPEGSFGFNASSRGRPFSGEPTLDQGVFNTAMKDAVMGFITGGPLGAFSQAVGTLATEGVKAAIGYRGAFFDAPASISKMLGPVGALLGPLAGVIGDAIGDAFDARSTEGLRDFMEASYGYKGGRLGFAEGFYDKIGTSEDPFGVTAQTASFEAGVASTLSSIQDSFSKVGIDVSTELTQAVIGIHAAMGYNSAAMAAAFGEIESNAMTSSANFGAMVDGVLGSFGFAAGDLATAIDDGAFSLGVSFGETTSSFSDVMGTTMGSFGAAIGDIESAIESGALSFGASLTDAFNSTNVSITDMIAALDLGVVATLGEIDAANTSSTKAASTWGDVYDSWAEIGWKGVASIQEIDAITVTLADVISNAWGSAKKAKDEAKAAQIAAGYAEIATEQAYASTNAARQAADSAAQSAADARDAANEGRGMGGYSGEGGDPSGGAGTGGTGSGTGQQEHWGGHIPITGNYLLKTGEEVIAPHIVTILSDLVGRIEESGSLSGGDSRPLHITVNVPEGEFETYVRRVSDDVRVNAERRSAGLNRLYL